MAALNTAISADGTPIAYERTGAGPPVVLIEPCGHYRGHSAFDGLRLRLANRYSVYSYDRRGRGASGDAGAYTPGCEVDDLAALIAAVGSPVFVYGYSSGALLALLGAARPLPIAKLALLEPPIQEPGARPDPLTTQLAALVAEGRFSDVVEHFHRSIGVPDDYIAQMRVTPAFAKMTAIAPTFVYDCRISDAITPTHLTTVETPTLVLDSAGSTDDLTGSAASVARMLPRAVHRSLPGQWHTVDDETLAAALMEFFTDETGA
jgi:pimeloyl-ACP methyl ester carboxylesterase